MFLVGIKSARYVTFCFALAVIACFSIQVCICSFGGIYHLRQGVTGATGQGVTGATKAGGDRRNEGRGRQVQQRITFVSYHCFPQIELSKMNTNRSSAWRSQNEHPRFLRPFKHIGKIKMKITVWFNTRWKSVLNRLISFQTKTSNMLPKCLICFKIGTQDMWLDCMVHFMTTLPNCFIRFLMKTNSMLSNCLIRFIIKTKGTILKYLIIGLIKTCYRVVWVHS